MMRTVTAQRGIFRFEVAVFTDGAVASRRYGPEPLCDWTDTFDGITAASEELGIDLQGELERQASVPRPLSFQDVSGSYEATEDAE